MCNEVLAVSGKRWESPLPLLINKVPLSAVWLGRQIQLIKPTSFGESCDRLKLLGIVSAVFGLCVILIGGCTWGICENYHTNLCTEGAITLGKACIGIGVFFFAVPCITTVGAIVLDASENGFQ